MEACFNPSFSVDISGRKANLKPLYLHNPVSILVFQWIYLEGKTKRGAVRSLAGFNPSFSVDISGRVPTPEQRNAQITFQS